MKALIVDDAKVVRVALSRMMNQLGYKPSKPKMGNRRWTRWPSIRIPMW